MTTATAVDWRTQAMCRLNPDLWTTRNAAVVQVALHICRRHCPVLTQCAAHAQTVWPYHRSEVVLGGVAYANGGRASTRQTAAKVCGSCRDTRDGAQ